MKIGGFVVVVVVVVKTLGEKGMRRR